MNRITLDLQVGCRNPQHLPQKATFTRWLYGMLPLFPKKVEITIRLVDEEESLSLNNAYRGKDSPTNILSFPFEAPPEIKLTYIGDLVICRQVVEREAQEQNKRLKMHWAHMVIHGSLHLLGYNHTENNEAKKMKTQETKILQKLGLF